MHDRERTNLDISQQCMEEYNPKKRKYHRPALHIHNTEKRTIIGIHPRVVDNLDECENMVDNLEDEQFGR